MKPKKQEQQEALAIYSRKKTYAAVAASMNISPAKAKRLVVTAQASINTIRGSAYTLAIEAYEKIVDYMASIGHYDKANMADTPRRAANAIMELIQPNEVITNEINTILEQKFPVKNGSEAAPMVISLDNRVVSMCPHHFLPVIYMVDMAYLPHEYYLGLSKPTRIAEILGKRPVLQEQYTYDLADVLNGTDLNGRKVIKVLGSAVRVRGWHSCMACRGVRHQHSNVITRALRGEFLNNTQVLQEFDANLPPLPPARGIA